MWGKGDVGAKAHPEARIGAGVPIRSGGIGAAHAGNVESMPGHSLPDTIATRKSMMSVEARRIILGVGVWGEVLRISS